MKTTILLIVMLAMMTIKGVCVPIPSINANLTEKNNKIDLSGNFPTTGTRSAIQTTTQPIQLFQNISSLQVNFSRQLGYISIIIYDNQGVLRYQELMDTTIGSQFYVSILNFEKGKYTVRFINMQDQYLQGNFVIQE